MPAAQGDTVHQVDLVSSGAGGAHAHTHREDTVHVQPAGAHLSARQHYPVAALPSCQAAPPKNMLNRLSRAVYTRQGMVHQASRHARCQQMTHIDGGVYLYDALNRSTVDAADDFTLGATDHACRQGVVQPEGVACARQQALGRELWAGDRHCSCSLACWRAPTAHQLRTRVARLAGRRSLQGAEGAGSAGSHG